VADVSAQLDGIRGVGRVRCGLWKVAVGGQQVVNVESQVVGLAIQALDEEQTARDGRGKVLTVGEEVAESGLDVGIDLSARVQVHGHVKAEHLGAHVCAGAFDVARSLLVLP
jgi:hypothetical protein